MNKKQIRAMKAKNWWNNKLDFMMRFDTLDTPRLADYERNKLAGVNFEKLTPVIQKRVIREYKQFATE